MTGRSGVTYLGEHAANKNRRDVEKDVVYESSTNAFDSAWQELLDDPKVDNSHLLKLNTSKMTPIQIVKAVVERLNELNGLS